MTLNDFVKKYEGKKVEFDGKYLYQCVDLVQFYNKEVINGPRFSGNAIDYARNQFPNTYNWKKNTPLYIPPKGAIAVWNGNVGNGYGHNGIVLSASLMTFTSFDQNWPVGSESRKVKHTYRNVQGFLVPIAQGPSSTYEDLYKELQFLVKTFPSKLPTK